MRIGNLIFLFVYFSLFFSIMLKNLLADYNWKHRVCNLTFNNSIATVWLCSGLCASQIDHQALGKLNGYFEWIWKSQTMCLAAFYSFAYSQGKASVTGLDQSQWFLPLSEPLIFSCQDPAHSPLKLSELSSVSEGGRMVRMEASGQVVSKSTFRNVSLFCTCIIWASSAVFPAVAQCSLNKTHTAEGRRLGSLCYCYRRTPFSVSLQQGVRMPSTVHAFLCLVNWKEL